VTVARGPPHRMSARCRQDKRLCAEPLFRASQRAAGLGQQSATGKRRNSTTMRREGEAGRRQTEIIAGRISRAGFLGVSARRAPLASTSPDRAGF